jgi:hypothetical protein
MLRTSISYNRQDGRQHSLVVEMRHAVYPLVEVSGMELTYATSDNATGTNRTFAKGALYGYQGWSEAPAALTLRALHTLQTQWMQSVPSELDDAGVKAMSLDIEYRRTEKEEYTSLQSVSAAKESGTSSAYQVFHSGGQADVQLPEMQPNGSDPLCLAIWLLAYEHAAPIELDSYPAAQQVAIDSDVLLHRTDIGSIVPEYARPAFRVFTGKPNRPPNNGDLVGRHRLWDLFRRT